MKRKPLLLSGLVAVVGVGSFAVGRADIPNPFAARAEYFGRIADDSRENPDFFTSEALQEAATDKDKLSMVGELSLKDARNSGTGGARSADLLIVIARQNQVLIEQNKLILAELRKPKK